MKTLLIGCGAVGLAIASALYSADGTSRTDLIARGRTLAALKDGGLSRRGIFPEIRIPAESVRAYENIAAIGALPGDGYDYVLVSAKTTGNADIAAQLRARPGLLAPDGKLVLFQNGFGNERAFGGFVEPARVFHASFAIGFCRPAPNVSEVTVFSRPFTFGSLFGADAGALAPLLAAMEKGGLPCRLSDDIAATLWEKMLYNCTLNPLSAILRVPYGGLVETESSVAIMNGIIDEIFAVMSAAGYRTRWGTADDYRRELYETILPPTYPHKSSTLQDMERGIKTEIDSLNGEVVRLGRAHGVPVSVNAVICDLVRSLEHLYK